MSKNLISLAGRVFGRLTVESEAERNGRKYRFWNCLCSCGNRKAIRHDGLIGGDYLSCGCLRIEKVRAANITHGMTNSTERTIWKGMISRCHNKKNKKYCDYGGRGIFVCDEWKKFENFLRDMGNRPVKMSIERRDNNQGYNIENCYWATAGRQARNKRSNILIEFNGEFKVLKDWANQYGIQHEALRARLRYGWHIHEALTRPIRHRTKH